MPSLQEAKAKADQIKSEKSDEIENAKQKAAELIATKAEQSLKSSVGFDEESQKKLGEIISVVGPLIEPYKTAFKDFFKSWTSVDDLVKKIPQGYDKYKELKIKRAHYLGATSYQTRKAIFYGSTALVFSMTNGIFKRFRRTALFGVVGGLLICPEDFGLRSKE